MCNEVIPPAKPFIPRADIDEMKEHLDKILTSGRLTLGEYTREFERQFANLVNVRHAIAVSSGTSALEIALRAHDLKEGDEVILPTNTFAATGAAVVFAGGQPVITDVSASTMTLDLNAVKQAITGRTRGVIAVHIGGLVCPEIESIREICNERDLFLIEDAAHAHGSMIGPKTAGSLGSAGCFSFYPTKIITSGEGGMITTDIEEIANIAGILRDQGKESFSSNRIVRLGYNWRMPEVCAALGILQLRRLPEFIRNRNEIAKIYDASFDAMGISRIVTPANQLNNYYKYTFFLPRDANREKFKLLCRERGVIFSGEVYWPPLHLQPAFNGLMHGQSRFDVAEEWGVRMVNPPMFTQMTKEQIDRVVKVTAQVVTQLKAS
jgi:dTDP-4-amino-4,6-dideoxygalactose transaminase